MLRHKSFIDINRFQTKYADCFEVGDIIEIQEKIDGSCSSIQYDSETDNLMCFSRKIILTPENNFNGFFEYVQNLDKKFYKKYEGLRFFGEFNLSHLIKYKPEMKKIFHCFDIYDTVNKKWLSQDIVTELCKEGNILKVPVFYHGEFISWEHVESFIGRTEFGLNRGEGVILKNTTKLNNPNSRQPFVVKFVSTEYQEISKTRVKEPINQEELEVRRYRNELTATIVTKNRVEKNLYKMITEGLLPEDWDKRNLGFIVRELPRIIYNDCVKEENDTVKKIEGFGKLCAKHTMVLVKELLIEKNNK